MNEYEIPPWCDVIRRPTIEVKDTYYITTDVYLLAEKLNKLLKEHVETQNWVADIRYAKEFQCKMCGNICEILLDEVSRSRTCNICGKGKLEYAVKKMAESDGVSVAEERK